MKKGRKEEGRVKLKKKRKRDGDVIGHAGRERGERLGESGEGCMCNGCGGERG